MSQYHRSHKVEVQGEQETDHIHVQSSNPHLDRMMIQISLLKTVLHTEYNSKFFLENLSSIIY